MGFTPVLGAHAWLVTTGGHGPRLYHCTAPLLQHMLAGTSQQQPQEAICDIRMHHHSDNQSSKRIRTTPPKRPSTDNPDTDLDDDDSDTDGGYFDDPTSACFQCIMTPETREGHRGH